MPKHHNTKQPKSPPKDVPQVNQVLSAWQNRQGRPSKHKGTNVFQSSQFSSSHTRTNAHRRKNPLQKYFNSALIQVVASVQQRTKEPVQSVMGACVPENPLSENPIHSQPIVKTPQVVQNMSPMEKFYLDAFTEFPWGLHIVSI